jgi:hypothetical protein
MNPLKGGMPLIANAPIKNATEVNRIFSPIHQVIHIY